MCSFLQMRNHQVMVFIDSIRPQNRLEAHTRSAGCKKYCEYVILKGIQTLICVVL